MGMPDVVTEPAQISAYSVGVLLNFSREYAMSWSFSARCVQTHALARVRPANERDSAADSRMRSVLTENGEHGARPTRIMA